MICMARIDDRLIHGQVAVTWSKELNVSRIIVASDAVAGNKIQVSALKMAASAGVKAAILTCDKAVDILSDPRSAALRILLISNDPTDLLRLFKRIPDRPVLDVANYGRISGALSQKLKVSDSVYLTEGDEAVIRDIAGLGIEVIHQPLPSDSRKGLLELIDATK